MADISAYRRHVVAACYLGWALDAFDYFIMAFALDSVAAEFHAGRTTVTWAFTLTLAMRPLGAVIFGRLADRFGRRPTLMANVVIYSLLECASGFAPSLTAFFVLRALYGIAMGGEWGVGAALTMESIPTQWRGFVSGLLQAGYPSGYLLAALVNFVAFPHIGWRGLFIVGVLPALLVFYIRRNVPESPQWRAGAEKAKSLPLTTILRRYARRAVFAMVLMAAFNFFSHGTQDLYKSFLAMDRHLPAGVVTIVLILMNIAAAAGGILWATLSQRMGRRRAIVTAALLCLPFLPLWSLSTQPLAIMAGAVLVQFCVQGAWGVIPAHLNEISPPEARGTFPGLTYQLGNLLASGTPRLQAGLADRYFAHDLAWPLALSVGLVAIIIAVLVSLGPEARTAEMTAQTAP